MRRSIVGFGLLLMACSSVSVGAPSGGPPSSPTRAGEPSIRPSPSPTRPPRFHGTVAAIDHATRVDMVGTSWHEGCPVPIRGLRLLTMTYWGFDGEVYEGPMVVNAAVAEDVLGVFRRLFNARFPIKRMALADKYRANDDRMTRKDVTSSFNCRPVTDNPGVWSQHAYGLAVDVNPLENPYVRSDGSVLRPAAEPYTDRSLEEPGMIHAGDLVVRVFARIGWSWGGYWDSIKDYQHFSANGR